jgi:hypothetical protein
LQGFFCEAGLPVGEPCFFLFKALLGSHGDLKELFALYT